MKKTLADLFRYGFLLGIKVGASLFYRFEVRWISPEETDWSEVRIVALLHHTSLLEWLYAAAAPNGLLKRIAGSAVVPIADKTNARPIVGTFLRSLAPHFVSISREADDTWQAVLERLEDDLMIVIAPEGRMMRANGLDKHGKPMTVRGGIADILRASPKGRMVIGYMGGLHHVQVPGQHLPKLFKTLRICFESVDIAEYRESLGTPVESAEFKALVKADLEQRRDLNCPTEARALSTRPRVVES